MTRGEQIVCVRCGGAGLITSWEFAVKEPEECPDCEGSGHNWRYPGGTVARYFSGPFVGWADEEGP